MNSNGDTNYNPLTTPDFFNNYILSITGKIKVLSKITIV
jgi:hypothetical protein